MADENKTTGADAAGGTLKDDAGSEGDGVTFGSMMMDGFGGNTGEDSEKRRAEAISEAPEMLAAASASSAGSVSAGTAGAEKKGLVLSGMIRLSEFLVPVAGDDKVANEVTGFQARALARMKELLEVRENVISNKGDSDPRVAGIDEELVALQDAILKDGQKAGLGEKSVLLEVDFIKTQLHKTGNTADGATRVVDSDAIWAAVSGERDTGRNVGAEIAQEFEREDSGATEPGASEVEPHQVVGEREQGISQVPEPVAAKPPELPEGVPAAGDSIDEAGTIPPGPVAPVASGELAMVPAGKLMLTPLDEEDAEMIGNFDSLTPKALHEMAAKRRKQVEIVFTKPVPGQGMPPSRWLVDLIVGLQKEGVDRETYRNAMDAAKVNLLLQADGLDALADVRGIKPKRPEPLRRKSVSPVPAAVAPAGEGVDITAGDVDELAAGITEDPVAAAFFGNSEKSVKLAREDGSVSVSLAYGDLAATAGRNAGKQVHVMTTGTGKAPVKKTMMGIPASTIGEAAEAAARAGSAGEKSGADLLGELEGDPELVAMQREGATPLTEEPALPAEELAGGDMEGIADTMKKIAGVGGTRELHIATPRSDAPEAPPYGIGTDAGEDAAAAEETNEEAGAELEGTPFEPKHTAVVEHVALTDPDGNAKVHGEEAFARTTQLDAEEVAAGLEKAKRTREERLRPDFSMYGDIFYSLEKLDLETGETPIEAQDLSEFGRRLERAIDNAQDIVEANKDMHAVTSGGTTRDEARVIRLMKFKADFVDSKEGKAPKKDFEAYKTWLAEKKQAYARLGDVYGILNSALLKENGGNQILGISPGEHTREQLMRICNARIKNGSIDGEEDERKVSAFREMLEATGAPRGDSDAYAPAIAAELTYEMFVGVSTKSERVRTRMLAEELKQYKVSVKEYEEKHDKMVEALARAIKATESSKVDARAANNWVKEALLDLARDHAEREKFMRMIRDAQKRKGAVGRELAEAAEERAAGMDAEAVLRGTRATKGTPDRIAELTTMERERRMNAQMIQAAVRAEMQNMQPKASPIKKGIGAAITMAAGAAILAGGLWLNQHGIAFGSKADVYAWKPVAAQVESADEGAEELPAGVQKVDAGSAVSVKATAKPAQKAVDAGVSAADAGSKASAEVEKPAEKPKAGGEPPKTYTRDKAGLKAALDDHCANVEDLAVSTATLRASYAKIEGAMDGKILPGDKEWVPMLLGMKYPNRIVELSVMFDLARMGSKLSPVEEYTAYLRMYKELAHRSANLYSLARSAGDAGIPWDYSYLQQREKKYPTTEKTRCMFVSLARSAEKHMEGCMKAALDAGVSEADFLASVKTMLGDSAEKVLKFYEYADDEVTAEGKKPNCRAMLRGKSGEAGIDSIDEVSKEWDDASKTTKKAEAVRQKEAIELTAPAVGGKTAPAPVPKAKGHGKPVEGSCTAQYKDSDSPDYLRCLHEQNTRMQKESEKDKKPMHAPKQKGREASTVDKAPRHVRF